MKIKQVNPEWMEYFNSQPVLCQKLIDCGYEIHIIDNQKGMVSPVKPETFLYSDLIILQEAWKTLKYSRSENPQFLKDACDRIFLLSETSPPNHYIRQIKNDPTGQKFVMLLDDSGVLPIVDMARMVNYSHIRSNHFPIHAAGIVHQKEIYLFGGPSGIGKSTISSLSDQIGDDVLDEDQLLLRETSDNHFSADAWGYSLDKCDLPLKAIFKLVQCNEDKLIRLSRSQTTTFMFGQVMEVMGEDLPKDLLLKIFVFVAKISRFIPGYELYFRKSPAFWQLIDAEFPIER